MLTKIWEVGLSGLLGCMFCGMVFASDSAPTSSPNARSAASALGANGLPANNPPIVTNTLPDIFRHEGDTFQLYVYMGFSDPDGDELRYEVENLPDGLSLDSVSGILTGGFNEGSSGTYEVVFKAFDPGGLWASQTATWTINKANEPPVVVSGIPDQYNDEGESINLDVNARFTDPDGFNLGFEASDLPSGLSMQDGVISGVLATGSRGSYQTKVTVTDLDSATTSQTFTWNVNAVPVILSNIPNQNNHEGDSVSLDIYAHFSDPEGEALYFQASGLPTGLSIDLNSGVISGNLPDGSSGSYTTEVKVSDAADAIVTQTFTWTVTIPKSELFIDSFE